MFTTETQAAMASFMLHFLWAAAPGLAFAAVWLFVGWLHRNRRG